MPKFGLSRTTQSESAASHSNMVEKPLGKADKEKAGENRIPKLDRGELEKDGKDKTSKRKLPFASSPNSHQHNNSDSEKPAPPERKRMRKDSGSARKEAGGGGGRKLGAFLSQSPGLRLGYPLSERQQMALLLQMTAESTNSPVIDGVAKDGAPGAATGQRKGSTGAARPKDKVNKRNERGETSLHMAAIRGEVRQLRELISRGADVNVKDFAGWTPLHEACNHGYYAVAKQLLLAGADVNTRGLDDDTPLHDAASNGYLGVVRLLMRYNADPYQKNAKGECPVDVACSTTVEKLLRKELSWSATEDSSAVSNSEEEPVSVAPSGPDEDLSDSEVDGKPSKHHRKAPATPARPVKDEYEFDEDDDDLITFKPADDKHLLKKGLKKDRDDDPDYVVSPPAKHGKSGSTKKPVLKTRKKATRRIESDTESSEEEDLPVIDFGVASIKYKTDFGKSTQRSDVTSGGGGGGVKESPAKNQVKEKPKEKQKLKAQHPNKENNKIVKGEKAKLVNSLLLTDSSDSEIFEQPKLREVVRTYSGVKTGSLTSSTSSVLLTDKHSKASRADGLKSGMSPANSDVSFQSGSVRTELNSDSDDRTSETCSSSGKSLKRKKKNKHRRREKSTERPTWHVGDAVLSPQAVDVEGKVVKKHKV
uniref:Uncharacterized protein n=1 Tax=Petromyzon marinus TaxID=7757 RepID=S4R595_PETMA